MKGHGNLDSYFIININREYGPKIKGAENKGGLDRIDVKAAARASRMHDRVVKRSRR